MMDGHAARSTARRVGFWAGLSLFAGLLVLPAPAELKPEAWRLLATTVLMAVWWVSEAIPIPATALLPILLFPVLGIMPSGASTTPYANHLIYLFLGGFLLAVTMQRWQLHRRIALHIIRWVGASPLRMVLGFMLASALLSMWVSNTATTLMMVPIAMAVLEQAELGDEEGRQGSENFARCLMLGIAYASSIGGVATLIGTAPNTVMAAMIEKLYQVELGFAQWMALGVPLAAVMIGLTWLLLTQWLFPLGAVRLADGAGLVVRQLAALGPLSSAERRVLIIGLCTAALWIARDFLRRSVWVVAVWPAVTYLHDATVAIACGLALFVIPAGRRRGETLLDWPTAVTIPWDVLVLFGGGLAIAKGFGQTGLADYLASRLGALAGVPMPVFVSAAVLLTIFMTELTSNTATATLLVPVMGSAAVAMGVHPFATIVSTTIASSFAFMLPVATPPNAVVFASGRLRIKEMAWAGLWLNLIGSAVIVGFVAYLLPLLWGVDLRVLPSWPALLLHRH